MDDTADMAAHKVADCTLADRIVADRIAAGHIVAVYIVVGCMAVAHILVGCIAENIGATKLWNRVLFRTFQGIYHTALTGGQAL